MSEVKLIQAIKRLKQKYPKRWFDLAIEQFGFDQVVGVLGGVNA